MKFAYYWDCELFEALLRYRMRPYLADIIAASEGKPMATAADLEKMIANMQRAKNLTERAAEEAPRHAAIMDAFEQRMKLNDENMLKIAEYEKLMALMNEAGDNGGPAIIDNFSTGKTPVPPLVIPDAAPPTDDVTPARYVRPFNHATGDPIK